MIRYLSRACFRRRSPLRSSPIRLIYRYCVLSIFIFILLSFFIPTIFSLLIFHTHSTESSSSDTIISLTTVPTRFHAELPLTIHSLLSQTELPKEIRIYLSPAAVVLNRGNLTRSDLRRSLQRHDASELMAKLFDRLVQIRLEEEDLGPATKYLPILREFRSKRQAIMICDDDQYYHPYTLATLNKYAVQYPDSIIGFRGWRIRKDLTWGVPGNDEIAFHIVQSYVLSEIYRVGVLTATHAYLLRSSFFDSTIESDLDLVSDDIRRVDDIWINGHAAKRNIARYVIPSCCSAISLTQTYALEDYLQQNQMDRISANNHALQWFSKDWEKNLWYRFNGENRPNYRSWWTLMHREWTDLILRLKFFVYFGFV